MLRLLRQAWSPPLNPSTSFTGKTILITGANTGLGFEAAKKFHAQGASRLILGVRNTSSGEAARRKILTSTSSSSPPNGTIEVWPLDMLSYPSIQAFASRVEADLPRLDIAVLNAGVVCTKYATGPYGWEKTLQTNTLSTVLLGLLLLPKLRASKTVDSTAVLEFVSSGTHKMVKWDEDVKVADRPMELLNTRAQETYSANRYYASSKLFLMCALPYFGRLAEAKDGSGELDVVVTSVCPGFCKSRLARDYEKWWVLPLIWIFQFLFMRSTEGGARTLVSGATKGKESHGGFWQNDAFQSTASLLDGEEGKQRGKNVWHEIQDALRKDVPEVLALAQKV